MPTPYAKADLNLSTIDTRTFNEQISQPAVTQNNSGAPIATIFRMVSFTWTTAGDPGLGTKVGSTKSGKSVRPLFPIS